MNESNNASSIRIVDLHINHCNYSGIKATSFERAMIVGTINRCGCYYAGFDIKDVLEKDLDKCCSIYVNSCTNSTFVLNNSYNNNFIINNGVECNISSDKYIIETPKIGNTNNRPDLDDNNAGFDYYDINLKKKILWNGTAWVNLDGTELTQ